MKKQLQEISYLGETMIEAQQKLERMVIGEIMIDKDAVYKVGSVLKPELFTDGKHQIMCNALMSMFKNNQPVDLVTLTKELMSKNQIEVLGGIIYVSQLSSEIMNTSNLEVHFKMLQENYIRRQIVNSCSEIRSKSLESSYDVFDLIEEHNKVYSDVVNSVLVQHYNSVASIHENLIKQHLFCSNGASYSGVPTELKLVDNLTNGWQKSDLIILAGRPAMGKTSCAIVFAMNPAIFHKVPVAFFSLEMSSEQVVSRMQSILSEIDVSRLVKKQLRGDEILELEERAKALKEAPIYIDDTASISVMELKSKSRQLVKEKGVKILIIDYLQLMKSGTKNQSREQEIGEISRGLKAIAKELNVPVIALSQLSRNVEGRGGEKKPQLSDLRESGQIEQDADMVMFCYRPEYYEMQEYEINGTTYPSKGLFLLLVAKHRNGSLGDIPLQFIHQNTNIVNNPNFLPQSNVMPQIVQAPIEKSNSQRFDDFWKNIDDEEQAPF